MNFEQLKKNVGAVVRIHPVAHRKDEHEVQLPDVDDDWIIDAVVQDGIRVSNIRTGHTTLLAKDHIHHYTSDPERSKGGQKRGFLTLLVQVTISGAGLKVDPLRRPGAALPRKSA